MTQLELQTQVREKGMAAGTSVVAAVFLTGMKLAIGISTGSLGILAEAAHSALDLGAALITFFAIRVSDRPADESHLYGHGKVENLSALAETVLLLITCAWIIYEALHRLFVASVEVDPSIWAFLTMGISIVVDFSRSRVLARAAKKYKSQALEADALHFSTDIWSSSVVIGGLTLVWIGEFIGLRSILMRADAAAALGVALIVIYVSIQLGRRTIDALLDSAPRGLAEQIEKAAGRVGLVRQVNRTRVRGSGSQIFVDLSVDVPRHLSFEESHAVTNQVREAVHEVAPNADITIHTVPVSEGEGLLERIQAIAARGHFSVHNITTHVTKGGMWVDLDLEVPPDISFERAHTLATELERELRSEIERAVRASPFGLSGVGDVNIHIEPRAMELVSGDELTAVDRDDYEERIRSICLEIPATHACSDVDLQRLDGEVYLAFHLLLDPQLSVAQVHAVTEDVENRLRRELPQLGRVVIHAEPYVPKEASRNPGGTEARISVSSGSEEIQKG